MMRFIGQAYKGAAANDHFNILEELHKKYTDLYPQIKYIVDTKTYTADGLPYTYSEPVQRYLMLQDEAHPFDYYPNSSPLASDMDSNLYDRDDSDLDAVLDCLAE